MRYIKYLLAVTAAVVLAMTATSCAWETDMPAPDDDEALIVITASSSTTKATRASTDNGIANLRILLFNSASKVLEHEFYYPNFNSLKSPVELKIKTGTFDFVFIANEETDPRLHSDLGRLKTKISTKYAIEQQYFSSVCFDEDINIPMVADIRNVQVVASNSIDVDGTPHTGIWNISPYLKRLAVKISIEINANHAWFMNAFDGLDIANIPNKVYLFENKIDNSFLYNGTNIPADFENTYRRVRNYDYQQSNSWEKDRIIVPSSVFADKSNKDKAFTLRFNLAGVDQPKTTYFGFNEAQNDYTSPRNVHYSVRATLQEGKIGFDITVAMWPEEEDVIVQ